MENKAKNVYFVAFYSDQEKEKQIVSYPSVWSKIDYIVHCLKKNGFNVNILSVAPSISGRFKGRVEEIDGQEKRIYLSSRHSKFSLINKIGFVWHSFKILAYLLTHVKKEDKVLVYHSLSHRLWIKPYRKIFQRKFFLEIEDVFSSLSRETERFQKSEWKNFDLANGYICINEIVAKSLSPTKPKVISYGSYSLPEDFHREESENIELVYAGVIERERNGAFLAMEAMRYLPSNYQLHILGFGKSEDLQFLNEKIELHNITGENKIVFHGRMQGEEYQRFLQNCDIALSTHAYTFETMKSAEHTFPSKVLVYMANKLRVVAQRLECLESCAVGDMLYYYDEPNAKSVAATILGINLNDSYDSRERIAKLDESFIKQIGALLKGE